MFNQTTSSHGKFGKLALSGALALALGTSTVGAASSAFADESFDPLHLVLEQGLLQDPGADTQRDLPSQENSIDEVSSEPLVDVEGQLDAATGAVVNAAANYGYVTGKGTGRN